MPAIEIRAGRVASVKDARQAFGVTLALSGSIQRLPSTPSPDLESGGCERPGANWIADDRPGDLGREVITQDTVIDAATALLALELEPVAKQALTAGGTAAPDAYELYVQGRGYLQRFDRGADNIDLAIDAFSRAIAMDRQLRPGAHGAG